MYNAETTVEIVKQTDPEVTSDLSDSTIQALIENAKMIALGDQFPKQAEVHGEILPVREMATRYMTLHLCAMEGELGRGVTSEKIDALEVHYADRSSLKWLQASAWGQAYARLYKLYGGGPTYYDVVQH